MGPRLVRDPFARHGLDRVGVEDEVVLRVPRAEDRRAGLEVQRHPAPQPKRLDTPLALAHDHGAAAGRERSVDLPLDRRRRVAVHMFYADAPLRSRNTSDIRLRDVPGEGRE